MPEFSDTVVQFGSSRPAERIWQSGSKVKLDELVQTAFTRAQDARLHDHPQFILDDAAGQKNVRFFIVHEEKPENAITHTRNLIATHRLKDPNDPKTVYQEISFEFHIDDHLPTTDRYKPKECIISIKNAGETARQYIWTPENVLVSQPHEYVEGIKNKVKQTIKSALAPDTNYYAPEAILNSFTTPPWGLSRRKFLQLLAIGAGAVIGEQAVKITAPIASHELINDVNKKEKERLERAGIGPFYGAFVSIRKLNDTYHTDLFSNQIYKVLEGVALGTLNSNHPQVKTLADGWGIHRNDMSQEAIRRAKTFEYHGFPSEKLAQYQKIIQQIAEMYPGAVLISPTDFHFIKEQQGGGHTTGNFDSSNGLVSHSLNDVVALIALGDVNFSDYHELEGLRTTIYHEMSHSIDLDSIGFTDVDRLRPYVSQEVFANYLEAYAEAVNGTIRQWLAIPNDVDAILAKGDLPLRISYLERYADEYATMNGTIQEALGIPDAQLDSWVQKYASKKHVYLKADHQSEELATYVRATEVQIRWNFLARRFLQKVTDGDTKALTLLQQNSNKFKKLWEKSTFFELQHYLTGPIFRDQPTSVSSSFFVSHAASLEHARLALIRPESKYPEYPDNHRGDEFVQKLEEYGAKLIASNETDGPDKTLKKVQVLELPPPLDETLQIDSYLILEYDQANDDSHRTTVVLSQKASSSGGRGVQFHPNGNVASIGDIKIGITPEYDTPQNHSTTQLHSVTNQYLDWNETLLSPTTQEVLVPMTNVGSISNELALHPLRTDVLEQVDGSLSVPFTKVNISSIIYTPHENDVRFAMVMTEQGPKSVVTINQEPNFLRDAQLAIDPQTNEVKVQNPKMPTIQLRLDLSPEVINLIQKNVHDHLMIETQGYNQGSSRFMLRLITYGGSSVGNIFTIIPYVGGMYTNIPKRS